MIHDRDTNKLFLAGCLPQKQPDFFRRFEGVLKSKDIGITFLPDTKDIWSKDYMPIQINRNKFVRFAYNPDYLNTVKFRKTISDSEAICKQIEIHTESSDIILDGGNVVTDGHAVIMCDKVFKENSHIPHNVLIGRLEQLFETDTIIFIPVQKVDIIV